MRVVFKISVFLSGVLTIGTIWIVHQMTANFNPNGSNPMWSNGNPALFFYDLSNAIYFIFPIFDDFRV